MTAKRAARPRRLWKCRSDGNHRPVSTTPWKSRADARFPTSRSWLRGRRREQSDEQSTTVTRTGGARQMTESLGHAEYARRPGGTRGKGFENVGSHPFENRHRLECGRASLISASTRQSGGPGHLVATHDFRPSDGCARKNWHEAMEACGIAPSATIRVAACSHARTKKVCTRGRLRLP
jgi:hypothetical protein